MLVLLPLATLVFPFLLVPALPADSLFLVQVVSVLAPALPFLALAVVAVLAVRWSGRVTTGALTTGVAALVGFVGGVFWMLAIWPTGG